MNEVSFKSAQWELAPFKGPAAAWVFLKYALRWDRLGSFSLPFVYPVAVKWNLLPMDATSAGMLPFSLGIFYVTRSLLDERLEWTGLQQNKSWPDVVKEKGKGAFSGFLTRHPYPTDTLVALHPSNQSPPESNSHTWYLKSSGIKWNRIENLCPWPPSSLQPPNNYRTFPGLQKVLLVLSQGLHETRKETHFHSVLEVLAIQGGTINIIRNLLGTETLRP